MAALLHNVLRGEGATVVTVSEAKSMQSALAHGDHDAVVLDVRLPGEANGFALAALARDYGCAVVLITGDHSLDKALDASGYRYLLKPFPVGQLCSTIERAIQDTLGDTRRGASE